MKNNDPVMMTNNHPVLMYDGTFKFVQDIKVGDKVVDVNFEFATVSKIIQGEQGNGNPTVTIKESNTEIKKELCK